MKLKQTLKRYFESETCNFKVIFISLALFQSYPFIIKMRLEKSISIIFKIENNMFSLYKNTFFFSVFSLKHNI